MIRGRSGIARDRNRVESIAPGRHLPHDGFSIPTMTMRAVYELDETRIAQLHAFFTREWWTAGRSFEETRRCVEGSQICIGLIEDDSGLVGFARVITDYTFKALIFDIEANGAQDAIQDSGSGCAWSGSSRSLSRQWASSRALGFGCPRDSPEQRDYDSRKTGP